VQGGDWRGTPAVLSDWQSGVRKGVPWLWARTTPRHWANGALLPEVVFEQRLELRGDIVHTKFTMRYNGRNTHAPRHQEIPAVFVEPQFATLAFYEGDAPWSGAGLTRRQPGWPNEHVKLSENWAAYLDETDWGVGIYVPVASEATSYRFQGGGNSNCSYIAPITTFALKPDLVWQYDAYLTIGYLSDIRSRFTSLRAAEAKRTVKRKK
jgi:hypothetical protein